jgi:hypothetical protein
MVSYAAPMPAAMEYCVIVTYGRSGSTALQAAANALPGVLIRGENYSALRGVRNYLQSVAATADRHHAGRPNHPWFGSARMDARAARDRIRAEVMQTVLRPRAHTKIAGFKEIRYTSAHWPGYDEMLEYLLFLNTLLPGVRYVVNTRSAQSAQQSAWWQAEPDAASILQTSHDWLVDAVIDLQAILGADRAVHLRFEDWRSNPDIVSQAFATVGLPSDPTLIREALGQQLEHGP